MPPRTSTRSRTAFSSGPDGPTLFGVNDNAAIEILDVTDVSAFDRLPPCADPGFDHRSCDYWEDEVRGSKSARPSWWQTSAPAPAPMPKPRSSNPFAPEPSTQDDFNPFAAGGDTAADPFGGSDLFAAPEVNPFAPAEPVASDVAMDAPSKLRLLDRGHAVFGSYAKVLLVDGEPGGFAQFGPLSAYPRAQQIRELYPKLPQSPLPAVITCIGTSPAAQGQGHARRLVQAVIDDLSGRGFSAIEAYPDMTLEPTEASAATPGVWESVGFALAAADERYPVMRRELA